MEIKESEKIVIAKPVAWRPGFPNVRSFSELLAGAVNAATPAAVSETSVAAIKPRTMRFKPGGNRGLVGAEVSRSAASDPTSPVPKSNVIYKPIAKLVSKATISLLANLGNSGPQRDVTDVGVRTQPNEVKHQTDQKSDSSQHFSPETEQNRNRDKSLSLQDNRDRPLYDGHNWRKYGQKQVKGSEYTRGYYKCTFPNCPVKKKVERTLDGQVAERVYKGEHNHSNPQSQPLKGTPPDKNTQRSVLDETQNEMPNPMWVNHQDERSEECEDKSENCNDIEPSAQLTTFPSAVPPINDSITAVACNAGVSNSNNLFGSSGECGELREALDAEGSDFKSKRRKCESQSSKVRAEGEATSEPQVIIQNNTDSEVTGDGYRWRKYGQKVVKGNPYPRSYYRCTSTNCNAKKYVERTSEDLASFITTYEGKHNHDMPIRGTSSEAFKTSSKNNS